MSATIGAALDALLHQVCLELQYAGRNDPALLADTQQRAIGIVRQFGAELPKVREALDLDVTAAYQGDPAAHSADEVLLCYPGVTAMIHHRLANVLYRLACPCWRAWWPRSPMPTPASTSIRRHHRPQPSSTMAPAW